VKSKIKLIATIEYARKPLTKDVDWINERKAKHLNKLLLRKFIFEFPESITSRLQRFLTFTPTGRDWLNKRYSIGSP